MSLSQRTEMRRCGKSWPTEDAARCSKRYLAALDGSQEPAVIPCALGCSGWHVAVPPAPAKPLGPGRDTGPTPAMRAAVYCRDGWACVCCGISVIGRPHSVAHRLRRSQGGRLLMSNLLTALGLGNGMTGRDDHHKRIDNRSDPADELHGYSLRRGQDPRLTGVMYFDSPGGSGHTRWLTDEGDVLFEPPSEAGAA